MPLVLRACAVVSDCGITGRGHQVRRIGRGTDRTVVNAEARIQALRRRADLVARLGRDVVSHIAADLAASGHLLPDRIAARAKIEQLKVAWTNGRLIAGSRLQYLQITKLEAPEHTGARVVLSRVATDHQRREIAGAGRAGSRGGDRRHRLVPQGA
ncbi:hypothetical protein D3C72_1256120 [compost metagenome]